MLFNSLVDLIATVTFVVGVLLVMSGLFDYPDGTQVSSQVISLAVGGILAIAGAVLTYHRFKI